MPSMLRFHRVRTTQMKAMKSMGLMVLIVVNNAIGLDFMLHASGCFSFRELLFVVTIDPSLTA